ncbi:MAG TPA: DUF2124 family protein, partial [Methanospirillum sp.]|uniref:DUF2124 family protein n=1 Tax=Methanospirillum sp. TaxID=45200 RepID=UPI002D198BCB
EWRINMKNSTLQGIPGMLRPFKEYLETWSLPEGAEVVFFGVPGTCTPFVELLCYAARSLPCTFLFAPYLHENESRKMVYTEGLGFQLGEPCKITNPSVFILMGGLSMPGVPVKIEDAEALLAKYQDVACAGICFMHMFQKSGWLDKISFDLLIDATIHVDITVE